MSLINQHLHTWLEKEENMDNLVVVAVLAIGVAVNIHHFFW